MAVRHLMGAPVTTAVRVVDTLAAALTEAAGKGLNCSPTPPATGGVSFSVSIAAKR
jgi:hypothetical protein